MKRRKEDASGNLSARNQGGREGLRSGEDGGEMAPLPTSPRTQGEELKVNSTPGEKLKNISLPPTENPLISPPLAENPPISPPPAGGIKGGPKAPASHPTHLLRFVVRRVIGANVLLLTVIGVCLLEYRHALLLAGLCAFGFLHNFNLLRWYITEKADYLTPEIRSQLAPIMFIIPGLLTTPYLIAALAGLVLFTV